MEVMEQKEVYIPPCNNCIEMVIKDGEGEWCRKIKHPLQNGLAKRCHSEHCGGIE